MGVAEVVVEYVAKTDGLKKGLSEAESASKSTGDKIKGMGKAAVVAAGAAGVGALIATFKVGIDEFSQAAKVGAQTQAVITSTGGAAKVSAKHVEDLAGALMQKSGVDDEAIQSGENLLLTFKGIRNEAGKGNDVFDQTTKAALDMSVAMGTDVTTSAMQLGKALNDPVKGMTRLQKVGVTFTDAQKAQGKALEDSGHHLEAQKIILQELQSEFGGSAEAAGKTLPGQLNILKQNFNNLAGSMVGTLAPALAMVGKFLTQHPALFKAIVITVVALAAAMVALNIALAITAALEASVLLPALAVVAALAAFIAIAVLVYKNWDKITAAVNRVVDAIKTGLTSALNWLKTNWPYVVAILTGPFGAALVLIVKHWGAITDAARSALASVKAALSGFVSWLAGIAGTIGSWVGRIVDAFRGLDDPVQAGVAAIKGALNGLVSFLAGLVGRVASEARAVANAIKAPINAVLSAWNSLSFTVPKITLPSVKIAGHKIGGGSFGGFSIAFPNIPLLAEGGIVTGPTLAMLGEAGREAVVPLDAGAPPIEVRVYIGDTELKGMVRTEVRTANNRTAQVLLGGLG